MRGTIDYLKISNYRSIDVLELHDIKPFSVFAGPNGSGKSNFFDALDFVNWVIRFGVDEALKKHGGFENIRCLRRCSDAARVFEFESVFKFEDDTKKTETLTYHFEISQLDTSPTLDEYIQKGHNGKKWTANDVFKDNEECRQAKAEFLRRGKSFLPIMFSGLRVHLFNNFRLYRIDPVKAKLPVKNYDDSELSLKGRNLAAVLNRLEKNDDIRGTILEWMEFIIPGFEKVHTETERLSGSTLLAFKEKGIEKLFPAHLMSDGTIYLLSLLIIMLDRLSLGMTLIEEPERGLHPKTVMRLVDAFREKASFEHPIWLTTHNETLAKCLKNNELWLVGKKQGKTEMKSVQIADKLASSGNTWLTDVLSGEPI
ncbi:AAA family ATPase [Candidatus Parabeggiatoa sp. HSG14]|uniref:AAA family ATPase n=1 Tax=Candidatus Parabeggiatoa sp. HSG14 TaxID=3055593 RepID=UPI0025A77E58|nr:AAA family ATPase [Thiotrichales bacterium HSG14]